MGGTRERRSGSGCRRVPTLALVEADLDRALAQLHHKADAFEVQLADSVRPTRLHKTDAFQFFRRLVNYTPRMVAGAALQYDTHLDYFVADSALDCHRDHLELDAARVKVLTMKEPPSATFPQVLEDLYTLPGEFIACLEWWRIPNDRMRRDLQIRRRHFFNKRVSMVNYVSPDTRPDEMLVDESASATVRQLGDALTELEVNGHFFGECSLSLVLFSEDARAVERSAAEAIKVMASHDGAFIEETYNLLNAWLAIVPGNSAHNLRRLPLLETNYADLSFLFTLDTGEPRSPHLNAEALAVFETAAPDAVSLQSACRGCRPHARARRDRQRQELPAELPRHARAEVRPAHRHLRSRAQLPEARDAPRRQLSGAGAAAPGHRDQSVRARPDAGEPALPARLRPSAARRRRRLPSERRRRPRAVRSHREPVRPRPGAAAALHAREPAARALAGRLAKWVEGGRYAELFDHLDDTFDVQPFQVFDFEAMRAYPALLEPLLFYVLHRVGAASPTRRRTR